MADRAAFRLAALATAIAVTSVRLYKLDHLQRELYGDIEIVHRYVQDVLDGGWPYHFILSSGPLYHYLIAPIAWLGGTGYPGLKLGSVVVSMAVLGVSYLLSRRLVDDRFALLATLIAGMSSWLLVFSRLGNSQILVPLLAVAATWLIVRHRQDGRRDALIAAAVVASLGLYTYPQSFFLPAIALLTLALLWRAGPARRRGDVALFVTVSAVCALPFAMIVAGDPGNFFHGYIGGKLLPTGSAAQALVHNAVNGALAFHVRGDSIFRSNPSGMPHLDPVSGLCLLLGIAYWLMPARRRWSPALLAPFVLLQVPSILVLGFPEQVPSASRTLGAAPFAYILVASGIWGLAGLGRRVRGVAPLLIAVLTGAIAWLNLQRYFGDYLDGLPYRNTPVGQSIAAYADTLPDDTPVYLVGCCWAEQSMPEAPFVRLMMERPRPLHEVTPAELTCERLAQLPRPAVLVWSHAAPLPAPQLEACSALVSGQLYVGKVGQPIFRAASLGREPEPPPPR